MIYSLNKYNMLKPFQYWVDKGVKASLFFEWISVIDAIPKEWRSSHFIKLVPPLPNFLVPSSYKNRNCLNIRTSLDIFDNIHPRK